jgi:hypothetical protein
MFGDEVLLVDVEEKIVLFVEVEVEEKIVLFVDEVFGMYMNYVHWIVQRAVREAVRGDIHWIVQKAV